jgi:hypothetical protein
MMLMNLIKTVVLVIALICVTVEAQDRNDAQCALPQSIKVLTFETPTLQSLERIIPVMETNKDSHGFIITYAGGRSSLAEAQKRADLAKRELLENHQWINQSDVLNARLNTLVCGYRETPAMELWVTPVGAAPPVCAPDKTVPLKTGSGRNTRRRL